MTTRQVTGIKSVAIKVKWRFKMPYKGDWSLTIVGNGKIFPVDDDSIQQLFADFIATLQANSEQTVDLERSHIHQSEFESY